jgi:hypothetical protein
MDRLIEDLLGGMIEQQREKVGRIARRLAPGASRDDLLNPHDVAALAGDPQFNYEDGLLAGLLSAQMALRREAADRKRAD